MTTGWNAGDRSVGPRSEYQAGRGSIAISMPMRATRRQRPV
jgi:hypothetical protein